MTQSHKSVFVQIDCGNELRMKPHKNDCMLEASRADLGKFVFSVDSLKCSPIWFSETNSKFVVHSWLIDTHDCAMIICVIFYLVSIEYDKIIIELML